MTEEEKRYCDTCHSEVTFLEESSRYSIYDVYNCRTCQTDIYSTRVLSKEELDRRSIWDKKENRVEG